jgi:hypothetical protein
MFDSLQVFIRRRQMAALAKRFRIRDLEFTRDMESTRDKLNREFHESLEGKLASLVEQRAHNEKIAPYDRLIKGSRTRWLIHDGRALGIAPQPDWFEPPSAFFLHTERPLTEDGMAHMKAAILRAREQRTDKWVNRAIALGGLLVAALSLLFALRKDPPTIIHLQDPPTIIQVPVPAPAPLPSAPPQPNRKKNK